MSLENEQLKKQIKSLETQLKQLLNKLPEYEKAEVESNFKGLNIADQRDVLRDLHKIIQAKLLQSNHVAPGVMLYATKSSDTLSS